MKKWEVIVCGVMILGVLYIGRSRICEFINAFFYGEYVLEELTAQQKQEDFQEYYDVIVESVPYLEDIKEIYNIDFEGHYEYYMGEIEEAENNFEFFCTMKAIGKNIPSFHTDFCYPMYSSIRNLSCYNSRELATTLGQRAKIEAWEKAVEEGIQSYEGVNILRFDYVAGKYVVDELVLPDFYEDLAGYELVEIDGISVDEYIAQHISIFSLHYDEALKKPYRESVALNEKVGERVNVLMQNQQGEQREEKMFVDYGAEMVSSYGHLYSKEMTFPITSSKNIETYCDDENQLEYINIKSFKNENGEELRTYLENVKYDTIVIDLRENYGGNPDYSSKYLYPPLYVEDVSFTHTWKVPFTEKNKLMINDWIVRMEFSATHDEDFYYYSDCKEFVGEAESEKDIYYLAGCETGSAADTYLAMVKENNLGTIVGMSTGGEGIGASFICDDLENSALTYIYYPSLAYEEETQERLFAPTAPDYYVTQTVEEYRLMKEYQKEPMSWDYKKRLEYDAELKWVIENKE